MLFKKICKFIQQVQMNFEFGDLKISLNTRIFKPVKKWFVMSFVFKDRRHAVKIHDKYERFMNVIENFIESELDEPIGYILIDVLLNNTKRTLEKTPHFQDYLNLSKEDYFNKNFATEQDMEYTKVGKNIEYYNDLINQLENIKHTESDKFLADLGVNIKY